MASHRISSFLYLVLIRIMHLKGFRDGYAMDLRGFRNFQDFHASRSRRQRRALRRFIQRNSKCRIEVRSAAWSMFDREIAGVTLAL